MTTPVTGPVTGLLERAAELRHDRVPYVWATVVRAARPTSAKPGDAAIVTADGEIDGFVGGQCAESTVRLQAIRALASGDATIVHLSPEGDDAGTMDAGAGRVEVVNQCASKGTLEIFLQPVLPPPLVRVVGTAPIARALAAVGGALGYEIVMADDPAAPPTPDTAAVVVASHGRDELDALSAALRADVPYVGLVASRRRGESVVAQLPFCDGHKARVHTPAGLDIGAVTPAEVALSILAEIVAEIAASRPRPAATEPAIQPAAVAVAIDPVCHMEVAMVPSSLHVEHEGRVVWFCGSGCQSAFTDDPARYPG